MGQILRGMQTDLDLSRLAPVLRKDEMGSLAHSLNEVIRHFRGLIAQINETAEQLARPRPSWPISGSRAASDLPSSRRRQIRPRPP